MLITMSKSKCFILSKSSRCNFLLNTAVIETPMFLKSDDLILAIPKPGYCLKYVIGCHLVCYAILYIYMNMVVENYMKDSKESVYDGAVVNALAVDFTMLGKSLIKMSPNPHLWVSLMPRMV